ncbi:galactose-binding lectin l-1-like isoform X2 [Anguilla anguilla]|uniref:galactose-binding lectin l-1-like isoform X2 n=1 Tax=Anguilla anguilla TaxID=7936 RepID=UPI0015AEB788|nr:galactose-binding lectin l-1-like isoform X2 [Anguilla anguilla]
MSDVELKNISFKPGMELKVTGIPKPDVGRFMIKVGHSRENIALHFEPRFNHSGEQHVIVLNSRKDEHWHEEVRDYHFPFRQGQEFEVTIIFADDKFYINQHNGHVVQFPNRLGDKQYDYILIEQATVSGIDIK